MSIDNSPPVYLPPDLVSEVEILAAPTNLWHLPRSLWDGLWGKVKGVGVKAAVLDTGMNSHDVLPDPVEARSFVQGESWRDGNGHGTHCAGTVLGREGIGLAPAASLLVGKVLSNGGSGSSEGIAQGIRWAADNGADVISMSLGSGSPYGPMESAIKYAWEKGCVVVAAAGNSGFSGSRNTIGYPAKYMDCLCVGASRSDGQRASFSSGGREMDVVCPGQDIISCSTTNGYRSMSGTSMATPFFAGLCCLIIELMRREGYAAFTGAEAVRTFLAANTIDKGEPGRDPFWGFGVPDSRRIIEALNQETIVWL